MKNEDLKAEAKRLRSAIAEMFGIPVSIAQSLELIAKAKNFPTWDAACGSALLSERTPLATTGAMSTAKHLEELGLPDDVLSQIKAMVASTVGIFLVAGSPRSGRSTTLAAVMLEAVARRCKVATLETPIERAIPGAWQYMTDASELRETLGRVMRAAPDTVMMHDLRDSAAAVESAHTGETQVWAGITSRVASLDAVMESLRAIDPDGHAAKLVRGVIWQSLTVDGRIDARTLLQTPPSRTLRNAVAHR